LVDNYLTIGIISDDTFLSRKLITIWVNSLARTYFVRFLEGTEEVYFKSLINILKNRPPPWKMYLFLEIKDLKKRIGIIEIGLNTLTSNTLEGDIERSNLKEVKSIVIVSNKSQLRPEPLYTLILQIKGRRRFLRKIVKDPVAIVLDNEKLITPRVINYLTHRYRNYKIFKIINFKPTRIEKIPVEDLSQPFLWTLQNTLKRPISLIKTS